MTLADMVYQAIAATVPTALEQRTGCPCIAQSILMADHCSGHFIYISIYVIFEVIFRIGVCMTRIAISESILLAQTGAID